MKQHMIPSIKTQQTKLYKQIISKIKSPIKVHPSEKEFLKILKDAKSPPLKKYKTSNEMKKIKQHIKKEKKASDIRENLEGNKAQKMV